MNFNITRSKEYELIGRITSEYLLNYYKIL